MLTPKGGNIFTKAVKNQNHKHNQNFNIKSIGACVISNLFPSILVTMARDPLFPQSSLKHMYTIKMRIQFPFMIL